MPQEKLTLDQLVEVMMNMKREEMEAFAFKHGVTDLRAILKLINQKKKEGNQDTDEAVRLSCNCISCISYHKIYDLLWISFTMNPPPISVVTLCPPREKECLWLIYIYLLLANLSCYSVNQLMSS